MPYEPNERLLQHFEANGVDLTQQVEAQLQLIAPDSPNIPLYRDMILTALRMAQDDRSRWNAKITLQAIRELDHAFACWNSSRGAARLPCSARRARRWKARSTPWPEKWARRWRAPI